MAVDITNIQKMIFGVNYLGTNGGAEVEALWNSRMAPKEAYLLNAEPQDNPKEIFQRFRQQLVARRKTAMSGVPCILTFFVDYTSELHEMTAAAVWNLRNVFMQVLGCNVETVIQFAYVGEKGLDETTVQRSNIQKALEKNNEKGVYENYRLCLVGKSALQSSGGSHWKAAIVFLDLLRRREILQDYLPMAGSLGKDNVCFLRYGEFNENSYQELVEEQKRLMALLANADSRRLRALVEAKRNEMVQFVESRYNVDGRLHPQHPDMIVEARSGWFAKDNREAARKGKNPDYNNAQQRTKAAVQITGEWMRKEIEAWFAEQIAGAEQTLQQFFQEADVGVKLKLNPVEMQSALYLPAYPDPGNMPTLALRYSEQGAADEIGEYLDYIRKSCICTGLRQYTAALQAAFEAVPQDSFQIQKRELERERDRVSMALNESLDEKGFCEKVALENPPESVFEINTEMEVRSRKFLMCRSSNLAVAEQQASIGNILVHGVDEHLCGMVSFDQAPIKAVMIECVECKDWVLDELLPEVNYGF